MGKKTFEQCLWCGKTLIGQAARKRGFCNRQCRVNYFREQRKEDPRHNPDALRYTGHALIVYLAPGQWEALRSYALKLSIRENKVISVSEVVRRAVDQLLDTGHTKAG